MKAERCINEYTMQQLCMLNLNLIVACPPRRRSGYPFQSFLRRPTKKDFHYYPSRDIQFNTFYDNLGLMDICGGKNW